MKLWHVFSIIAFVALLFSPFSPLYWKIAHWCYEPKKQEAMRFCESLVPLVDADKDRAGQYPAQINPIWLNGRKVPDLIRLKHFYKADSDSYILYFWNPGDFWDDFWAYSSRDKRWFNCDANKPKD